MAKFKHLQKMHSKKPTQKDLNEIKKVKRLSGMLRNHNEGSR